MRLVLGYTDGDGCTYSCEVTECLVYSSADDFLMDLELKVNEWIEKYEKYCEEIKPYFEQQDKLSQQMRAIYAQVARQQESPKTKKKRLVENHKRNEQLLALQQESQKIAQKRPQPPDSNWRIDWESGYLILNLEYFRNHDWTSGESKYTYSSPDYVEEVDEWFAKRTGVSIKSVVR